MRFVLIFFWAIIAVSPLRTAWGDPLKAPVGFGVDSNKNWNLNSSKKGVSSASRDKQDDYQVVVSGGDTSGNSTVVDGTPPFERLKEATSPASQRKFDASDKSKKLKRQSELKDEDVPEHTTTELDSSEKADSPHKQSSFVTKFGEKAKGHKFGPGITKVSPNESVASLGVPLWRITITFTVLIGLIVLVLYLIKKLGKRFGGIDFGSKIKLVSRLQLDQKNSVALVRIYEQELLLGVSNENVRLLTKFSSIDNGELDDDEFDEDDKKTSDAPVSLEKGKGGNAPTNIKEFLSIRDLVGDKD